MKKLSGNEKEQLAEKKRQKILERTIPNEQMQIIKQPYNFALLKGSMKRTQQRQLILIMDELQPKIEAWLAMSRNEQYNQPRLFDDSTAGLTVSIRLKDLGISTQNYEIVKNAAELLSKQVYEYSTTDKDGNGVRAFSPLFKRVTFPEKNKVVRKKAIYIEFLFNDEILKSDLLLMSHYTKFSRLVAMNSSQYTSRLYIILSAYLCSDKKQWSIGYGDLRHILGVDELEGKTWRRDKYPQYDKFKRHILEKSKKELEDIAAHGNSEFTFSYVEEFRSRGQEPTSITFRLHLTDNGQAAAEFDRKRKLTAKLLKDTFGMNYGDVTAVGPALFELDEDVIRRIIDEIHERVHKRKNIVNVASYVVRSINTEVELLAEQAKAEAEVQDVEATEIKDDGQLSLPIENGIDAWETLRKIVYGELEDESFLKVWNKVKLNSYDADKNELTLLADEDVSNELESHPAFSHFVQLLFDHFGPDVKLLYII